MKNWRVNLIFFLLILFGAAIISRLIYIQLIQHGLYKALAQGQQKIFQFARGKRGEIFFKDGQILAANIEGSYLFVSPKEVGEKEKAAEEISQILGMEKDSILAKLEKNSLFEEIKSNLTKEEEESLSRLNSPGVYLAEGNFRSYPQGSMASQVVGFFGGEDKGQYGLEGYYDELLEGEEGFCDQFGREPAPGADLFLTLDYNIQFMAEQLLEQAENNLDIEGGQIVALEPASGRILALASFPNFDPNYYWGVEDFDIFQNPAVQKPFEPGSVFKPIVMAGALDKGKLTPQTGYQDKGEVKIGPDTIENYNERVWGWRTMTEVLEKSINTGAVFAEKQLGHQLFLEYIERFGLFDLTKIDLQGEVLSQNKEFKKGYEINFATASFGQGIEITPIQLVRAFSAIANGGKLVKPYLVERISEGGEAAEKEPEISAEEAISSKTASQLTAMLVSVVENGYGKGARVPGYYIAGKTGTAQIPWSVLGWNKRGYSNKTWQSFIGFGPALDAKFLILVKLDNPKTRTAEYSAVPIFKELAKYIIDYLEIPPDYESS